MNFSPALKYATRSGQSKVALNHFRIPNRSTAPEAASVFLSRTSSWIGAFSSVNPTSASCGRMTRSLLIEPAEGDARAASVAPGICSRAKESSTNWRIAHGNCLVLHAASRRTLQSAIRSLFVAFSGAHSRWSPCRVSIGLLTLDPRGSSEWAALYFTASETARS